MKRFYDIENNRLVYIHTTAESEFWDSHWDQHDIRKMIQSVVLNRMILGPTRKYLKKGSRILEGGCGLGQNVWSLAKHGYDAYGVDYAIETVRRINKVLPDLQVACQDIRQLDFEDGFFDGYWSLGVIEHFYNGFEDIVVEMMRVIKPGGYLFLTFPSMSTFRRKKAHQGKYPVWEAEQPLIKDFYQFALSTNEVKSKMIQNCFELIESKPISGLKGFKDEMTNEVIKRGLQKIYDSRSFLIRVLAWGLDQILAPYSGHCERMIFRRTMKNVF